MDQNPFKNLDALRCPQGLTDYLGEAQVIGFPVRTLKEGMHLRVNPDTAYRLEGVYLATPPTMKGALHFVFPQFRDAIMPLCKRGTLHVAVDGHGVYFLLLVKMALPGKEVNEWYRTARIVAEAAAENWIKVTKSAADDGWSYIPVEHKMFEPKWPDKSLEEILHVAFPDRVVDRIDHDLIKQFEERGV
jgi:hypothetical protein